ncbi:MAG: hypothetical protein ABW019_01255 [Chitinophagaceae bacterium]
MKNFFSVWLILITATTSAQHTVDSSAFKLFNRGYRSYESGNLDSALSAWTEIVEKQIGKEYDVYGYAFFNIPAIYWQMKQVDKAKEWYRKVLASDLRDNDETGELMEPHTNYKYKSSIALARLSLLDSNYAAVLQWLDSAETAHPYWGYEGSATNVSKEQAFRTGWKTDVLLKLGRKEEAIHLILTELICAGRLESFFKRSEDVLLTLIDKKAFRADLDAALDGLTLQSSDSSHWTAFFTLHGLRYTIPISKVYPDRELPHYWRIYFINTDQVVDQSSVVHYIRQRQFYQRLSE